MRIWAYTLTRRIPRTLPQNIHKRAWPGDCCRGDSLLKN